MRARRRWFETVKRSNLRPRSAVFVETARELAVAPSRVGMVRFTL